MKKQVFLLADIGFGEHNSFHVGDEAMFVCNLREHLKNGYNVVASSRSISYKSASFTEVIDIYITTRWLLCWLLFCSILLRYFALNLFPKQFGPTVKALSKSDLLHISGGGNINSFWPGHIYYRCLMIYLASLFNIPIIMTSQTIGPINCRFHRRITGWALNKVKFIGLRDNKFSKKYLKEAIVTKPLVSLMMDDASRMNADNFIGNDWLNAVFKKTKDQINIGLSLHTWQNSPNPEWIAKSLIKISERYQSAKFFAIPHLIDEEDGGDSGLIKKLFSKLSTKNFRSFGYNDIIKISKNNESIPSLIYYLTSKMDIVISSRYHGLVFSSALSVPAIAINYDEYYRAKNNGLLSVYYDKPFSVGPASDFLNIFSTVLLKRNDIKKSLHRKNHILRQERKYELQELINKFVK